MNPQQNVHVPKTRLCQRSLSSPDTGYGLYAPIGHAIKATCSQSSRSLGHFQKSASERQIKQRHKPRTRQGSITFTGEKMQLHKKIVNWPGPKEYLLERQHAYGYTEHT